LVRTLTLNFDSHRNAANPQTHTPCEDLSQHDQLSLCHEAVNNVLIRTRHFNIGCQAENRANLLYYLQIFFLDLE